MDEKKQIDDYHRFCERTGYSHKGSEVACYCMSWSDYVRNYIFDKQLKSKSNNYEIYNKFVEFEKIDVNNYFENNCKECVCELELNELQKSNRKTMIESYIKTIL